MWHNGKRAQTLELVQGWKLSHAGLWIMGKLLKTFLSPVFLVCKTRVLIATSGSNGRKHLQEQRGLCVVCVRYILGAQQITAVIGQKFHLTLAVMIIGLRSSSL